MFSKFKVKKKLVSIALALALAAQPLASFPMNVFAGTGKTGVQTAPRIQKKTVSVPVPTTFTVPLTGTFSCTGNSAPYTITEAVPATASFPVTIPVKLGDTVISSPGNVSVLLDSNVAEPETNVYTVPVTFTDTFTGNLSFPCELMVPVDVTARVTDDNIDIEAKAAETATSPPAEE